MILFEIKSVLPCILLVINQDLYQVYHLSAHSDLAASQDLFFSYVNTTEVDMPFLLCLYIEILSSQPTFYF